MITTLKELTVTIKNTVDLKDYLESTGIHFKSQSGGSWLALCPFHNEKTPSFRVSSTYQTYRCFGCGANGDIFTYVQEKEQLNWKETVTYIADENGIRYELDEDKGDKEKYSQLTRAYFIMQTLSEFFENKFKSLDDYHPAKQMVAGRKVSYTSASYGFAPENSKETLDYLHKKGIKNEELKSLGLLNDYGYFQQANRLTFTICNYMGKPVGFTGRAISEKDVSTRKYVNSTESIIYHKKSLVYNLDKAKSSISKNKSVYVVEGQFDVAALVNKNVENVVGVSGTAFTEEQLKEILKPLQDGKIILVLDSDSAGLASMDKIFRSFPHIQNQLYTINLPEGQDPCDYLMNNDKLPNEVSYIENKYLSIRNNHQFNTIQSKTAFLDELQKELTQFIKNNLVKEQYLRRACVYIGVNYNDLVILGKSSDNIETNIESIIPEKKSNQAISYYLKSLALILKYKHEVAELKFMKREDFPDKFYPLLREVLIKDRIILENYEEHSALWVGLSELQKVEVPDLEIEELESKYNAYINFAKKLEKTNKRNELKSSIAQTVEEMNDSENLAKLVDELFKDIT